MSALTIVLTGACGGIGKALAVAFSGAGHNLVLIGRNAEALAALRDRAAIAILSQICLLLLILSSFVPTSPTARQSTYWSTMRVCLTLAYCLILMMPPWNICSS